MLLLCKCSKLLDRMGQHVCKAPMQEPCEKPFTGFLKKQKKGFGIRRETLTGAEARARRAQSCCVRGSRSCDNRSERRLSLPLEIPLGVGSCRLQDKYT